MLNVYFLNKHENMSKIDLNRDLKEEPNLKSWCFFTLFENPGYVWIPMWANMPRYVYLCEYASICVKHYAPK